MTKIKPVVFVPDEPIEVGLGDDKKSYKELVFDRKMKGRDLLAMDAVTGTTRKSFALYASMSGVPIMVFDEMDIDDFTRLASAVAPLMGKRGSMMQKELEQLSGTGQGDPAGE